MKKTFIVVAAFLLSFLVVGVVLAEKVTLKSGRIIEGKIIERADDYFRIDDEGIEIMYLKDEIEKIEPDSINAEVDKESHDSELVESATQHILKEEYAYAAQILKNEVVSQPDKYELYLRLGICQFKLGQVQDAIYSFEKGASLSPNDEDIYMFLGIAYDSIGEAEKSKNSFSRIFQILNNNDDIISSRFFIDYLRSK